MDLEVDIRSSDTLIQIVMDSGGSTGDYARGFNVEVSTNGSTFTSVATGTGTSSPETVTFRAQRAPCRGAVKTPVDAMVSWRMTDSRGDSRAVGRVPNL